MIFGSVFFETPCIYYIPSCKTGAPGTHKTGAPGTHKSSNFGHESSPL